MDEKSIIIRISESKNATASNMSDYLKYQRPNGCDSWDHVGMNTNSWFFENGDGAISARAINMAFGTNRDKIFTTNDGNNNSKEELINAMFEDANSFYEGNLFPTALTGNGLKYSARRYLLDLIKKQDQRKMIIILPSKEEKGGYLALVLDVNAMEELNYYDPAQCVTFYSSYKNDKIWKPIPEEFIPLYKKIKKDVGQEEKGWLILVPYSDEGHDVIRTQMEERNKSLKDLPRIDRMSHKWGRTPIKITLIDKNKNKYIVPKYNPYDKNYPSKKKVERGIFIYENPSGERRFVRKVKVRVRNKFIEKYMTAKYNEQFKDYVDEEILLGEESEWQLVKEGKTLIGVDFPDNFFDPSNPKFPEPVSLNHRPYDEEFYISEDEKIKKDEKGKPHKVAPENLGTLSEDLYFRNGMFMGSGLSHDANNIHRTQGGHGNLLKKFRLYYLTLAFEWNSRTKHTKDDNNGLLLDKYIQDRQALINKHSWSPDMIRPEIKHHLRMIRREEGSKAFQELILFKLKFNNGLTEADFQGKKGPLARELSTDDIKDWAKHLGLSLGKGTKQVLMKAIRDKLRDDFLASEPLSSSDYSSSDDESKSGVEETNDTSDQDEGVNQNTNPVSEAENSSDGEESVGEQSGSNTGEDKDKTVPQVGETVPLVDEGKEKEETEEDDSIEVAVKKELSEEEERQAWIRLWVNNHNNPDFRKVYYELMEKYPNQEETKEASV